MRLRFSRLGKAVGDVNLDLVPFPPTKRGSGDAAVDGEAEPLRRTFVLAEGGQTTRAAAIFDAAELYQAATWEQAAIRLDRDAWLEARYLAIESPWRRSERFHQYARRKLDDGEGQEADRLAGLAAESAEKIPDGSTRWLAYQLLASYYARAGDPDTGGMTVRGCVTRCGN